ncbi:aminotransferase class I/II-fold pyridoxal phosphate-dependent enzyme [Ideonella livida]|uniref:Aminotransferase class I/II-fold pyridoxal phosphate-dependent enzyme n=1 Tax=Ideonella livida TaxID=2707176 RepID=A0A7C9TK00_9BURK|nr:aminotransferase class I/II-fold pyridoxal phosphate-dependent enzyme [Ideonella livida]NDY91303.1 aminotransferase class I/II-fold pyridoxal phosphate-dependent enzyme [Ideonella livida]
MFRLPLKSLMSRPPAAVAAELLPGELPVHGGPDVLGVPRVDFSTNANPLPPPAAVLQALAGADRCRYPEPGYHRLREHLAALTGCQPSQVLPSAGSAEAIRRLSLLAQLQGRRQVWLPEPGYADYRAAAQALGLLVRGWTTPDELLQGLWDEPAACLVWITEPHNPSGGSLPASFWAELGDLLARRDHWLALDRAYEPLRLRGACGLPAALAARAWQLWSPNKALGQCGVRAGWLQAPAGEALLARAAGALAPSWVLSAEGVALLQVFHDAAVQDWLDSARHTLRRWQADQHARLGALGWHWQPGSVTPFALARPPLPAHRLGAVLAGLRAQGLKLRDATSMGLPGWVRLSAQSPAAVDELVRAWPGLAGESDAAAGPAPQPTTF